MRMFASLVAAAILSVGLAACDDEEEVEIETPEGEVEIEAPSG